MKPTQSNRIATTLAFVLLVILRLPAAAAVNGNLEGVDATVLQLSKSGTTLEEVVALLGERHGTTRSLGPIVDPVRLIRAIQAGETATLK